MAQDEEKPPVRTGLSDPIKVALIGAGATVLVAVISGIFTLLLNRPKPTPTPAPVLTPTVLTAPAADLPATPGATATRETIASETGFAFASRITPDGMALDPGVTFPATVKEIYAVFQPGRTPPGLSIHHPNPATTAYYAYLVPGGPARPAAVGWRWRLNGAVVNEYESPTDVGYLWLSVYSDNAGLFEGVLGPPGSYEVAILLDSNPVLRTNLIAHSPE